MNVQPLRKRGFTLAEVLVATALLTIIMTSVYSALNTTLRVRRMGEAQLHTYQDARTTLDIIARETNCFLGGAEHLFQGSDDEFEFFAVTQPMNVDEGKGPRVLFIRYRLGKSGKERVIYREEAVVKDALPLRRLGEEEPVDRTRIKLGRKRKFEFAAGVRDFRVEYIWMPKPEPHGPNEPPLPVEPVVLDENREGWGLPQGMRLFLTIDDEHDVRGETTFTASIVFHGPTSHFDAERLGLTGEGL